MNNLFDKFQLWLEKRKQVKMDKWAVTRAKGKKQFVLRNRLISLALLIVWIILSICFYFAYFSWKTSFIIAVIFFLNGLFNGIGNWRVNEQEYQAFLEEKAYKEARIKRAANFMAKK